MSGLVLMLGSPAVVNRSSGNSAGPISGSTAGPALALAGGPMPRVPAMPMPPRPSMNSQSAHHAPAMAWKAVSNGPTSTLDRNPLVGDPPAIQALAAGVA